MATGIEYIQSSEKRALDITGAVLLTPSSMAVSGLASALLRSEIGGLGNTIFKQDRLGRGDESINVIKLRTIHGEHTDGLPVELNGDLDPRAGPLGKIIRKLSIDEFPQVYNVLKGSMSLVGPRPLTHDAMDLYEEADAALFSEWYRFYKSVRPGLCGYSQIMRKNVSNTLAEEVHVRSMELDLQYKEDASLATDIKILTLTPLQIIKATQATYMLDDKASATPQ